MDFFQLTTSIMSSGGKLIYLLPQISYKCLSIKNLIQEFEDKKNCQKEKALLTKTLVRLLQEIFRLQVISNFHTTQLRIHLNITKSYH